MIISSPENGFRMFNFYSVVSNENPYYYYTVAAAIWITMNCRKSDINNRMITLTGDFCELFWFYWRDNL